MTHYPNLNLLRTRNVDMNGNVEESALPDPTTVLDLQIGTHAAACFRDLESVWQLK